MKHYLILHLDAVLQSYGLTCTERRKGTHNFPTKSAIVGMLGSCLGIDRTELEKLAKLSNSLKMGARRDRTGRMIDDFQVVHGKHKGQNYENKLINKEYLSDYAFTVVLEGKKELLDECLQAIKNPHWAYTFGRANCIPSVPMCGRNDVQDIIQAKDIKDALSQASYPLRHDHSILFETEIEVPFQNFGPYHMYLNDVIEYDTIIGVATYGVRCVLKDFVERTNNYVYY